MKKKGCLRIVGGIFLLVCLSAGRLFYIYGDRIRFGIALLQSVLHMQAGRFPEALRYAEQALVRAESGRRCGSVEVSSALLNLAKLHIETGAYPEAEAVLNKAEEFLESMPEPDPSQKAMYLSTLGTLHLARIRLLEAREVLTQALEICREEDLLSSVEGVLTMHNLGRLYIALGRLQEAESLFSEVSLICEQSAPGRFLVLNTVLCDQAVLYAAQGRYSEAEAVLNRILGANSSYTSKTPALSQLASIYNSQGRFEEAEALLKRAIHSYESLLGPDHLHLSINLNNLATTYLGQGRLQEAEEALGRALSIVEKAAGTQSPALIMILTNLGSIYSEGQRFEAAAAAYERAGKIIEQHLAPDHPMAVLPISNLGLLYQQTGDPDAAERHYLRALQIHERVLEPLHRGLADTLINLAGLYFGLNDPRALEYARRAFDAESAVHAEAFSMLSEQQRIRFVRHRGGSPLRISASMALNNPADPQARRVAWQMVLRSKAAVLDAMLEDRQNLSGNPEAESLLRRISEVKKRTSALYAGGFQQTPEEMVRNQKLSATLRKEREGIEQQLARISGRFREGRRASQVTPEEVAAALPEETVLVEFLRIKPLVPAGPRAGDAEELPWRYIAFVLTAGHPIPDIVSVGDAQQIELLLDTCLRKMATGAAADVELAELYREVWAPLEHLTGSRRILISPDGALNQMPFAALRDSGGSYLIERHDIGYLSSPRDLIRTTNAGALQSPALFGDPAFRSPAAGSRLLSVFRSVPNEQDRAMYRRLQLPALPATREEVTQISRMLAAHTPDVFLGSEASEENLKKTVRPEILHLATHGFYFTEPQPGMGASGAPAEFNSMLRSGLALSGASVAMAGSRREEQGEDGIVTAEEVGSLDLWGTRLVVLSACDTGRGELFSGEGVFGLRRAFVQAGAQNLLLTLWRVEDLFTKELMLEFYREYVNNGDPVGALSRTQRKLLTDTEPRYWAPFLVSVQSLE